MCCWGFPVVFLWFSAEKNTATNHADRIVGLDTLITAAQPITATTGLTVTW